DMPRVALPGGSGTVRVIAGEFRGMHGPAETFTPIDAWDVNLEEGGATDLEFAERRTAILVVRRGEVKVGDETVRGGELALLAREGAGCRVEATTAAEILALSGEPIGEAVVGHGPFVMNSREEIHQAIADYQSGRMGRLV
ncbi:MAG TPA: pirin-like C-terminal cupin domain-containing protein, partial [Planctomycetia bacterium]|nr:pirin-like C-terminal cupin domain-containing protein [Planctomycetia bacterium]